jgi:hypothetical protein
MMILKVGAVFISFLSMCVYGFLLICSIVYKGDLSFIILLLSAFVGSGILSGVGLYLLIKEIKAFIKKGN